MRLILASLFCALVTVTGNAQTTATDFTTADCNGTSHHLFGDLDAGKSVVIVWVMPCATCINGALTAQTEVQSALASHPGKVEFFLADDYANTSCNTLKSWCGNNGITLPAIFSSNKIKMSDYGSDGMPKVVVIGGQNHTVFYNKNAPDITAEGIRAALASAVAAGTGTQTSVGTIQPARDFRLYPNPANLSALLEMTLTRSSGLRVTLVNNAGSTVKEIFNGPMTAGKQTLTVNTAGLEGGLYFVVIEDGALQHKLRLLVE